jgi:hypothetical protein
MPPPHCILYSLGHSFIWAFERFWEAFRSRSVSCGLLRVSTVCCTEKPGNQGKTKHEVKTKEKKLSVLRLGDAVILLVLAFSAFAHPSQVLG